MKRHIALQPLSREHHSGLLLAQLLRNDMPNYKGMPADTAGKIVYAKAYFQQTLLSHFEKEERIYEQCSGLTKELDTLLTEILAEHEALKQVFTQLDSVTTREDQLNEIGILLNDHIRKEEKQLFPMLEQYCDEALFEKFRLLL
ncbi:hemerythrin domain-containing protein [Sediminibacterium goheungense]|uniref:Hemerythrin HHE cation binding domain-containing protein n=1 Tax=Sediminibacterium goheungense TaxID=1086393 RepID=A0A4R6IVX4_9BACT|nr:hemerythrin domain-containing protein [Sediminibacterium goheungense]TDO26507.1 hemerythrin HHE cation binding domain-containing protein [Sediminibacterium goheungense]